MRGISFLLRLHHYRASPCDDIANSNTTNTQNILLWLFLLSCNMVSVSTSKILSGFVAKNPLRILMSIETNTNIVQQSFKIRRNLRRFIMLKWTWWRDRIFIFSRPLNFHFDVSWVKVHACDKGSFYDTPSLPLSAGHLNFIQVAICVECLIEYIFYNINQCSGW